MQATAQPPSRRRPFRRDIEGLRAVAVAAVVLYHAHIGWLGGGYAGVDVFFVISGFLITGQLWREVEGSGRLRLAAFYGRRARRLLPASMLVLVVTMAASARWLPPLQARSVWVDGVWCAVYAGNYRFAIEQTNYLLATSPPSPFLQMWSLGVEEQFYLVWPLLLLAAAMATRAVARRRRTATHARPQPSGRGPAVAILGAVTLISFAGSVVLTRVDQPWAFFALPTRAWELAAGGLVALTTPALRRLDRRVAAAVGWVGLAMVVVAVLAYSPSTAWPGTAAVLPVAGTAALIAGGVAAGDLGPVAVLGRRPLRFVGRISYSLYLWHWPVLILAPAVVGHPLGEGADLLLVGFSVVLATATYLLVERPTQHWVVLAPPARALAVGAGLSAAAVLSCAVAADALPPTTAHRTARVAALHAGALRTGPPAANARDGDTTTGTAPDRPTHAPPDPLQAQLDGLQAQLAAQVSAAAAATTVPANLEPPLADAAGDQAAADVDGCLLGYTATVSPTCLFGDPDGTASIVLFGDSHAAMWEPAVDAYATAHHDRLYVWAKATCPPVDLSMISPVLGRTFTECDEWRNGTIARIQALRPSLVVFGTAPNYDSAYGVVQDGPAWLAGLTEAIGQVRSSGAAVAVLGPIPSPASVVADCLSEHLDDTAACAVPAGETHVGIGLVGVDPAGMAAEAATVAAAGGRFVDVQPWFCTTSICPVIVGNLLVYRDGSHLTATFATFLAPLIGDELALAQGA